MPLKSGTSAKTRSGNIAELIDAGHSKNQAVAIAYRKSGDDAEFNESDHPRAGNGQFGAGSVGETAKTGGEHSRAAGEHSKAAAAHRAASTERGDPHDKASMEHENAGRFHRNLARATNAPEAEHERARSSSAEANETSRLLSGERTDIERGRSAHAPIHHMLAAANKEATARSNSENKAAKHKAALTTIARENKMTVPEVENIINNNRSFNLNERYKDLIAPDTHNVDKVAKGNVVKHKAALKSLAAANGSSVAVVHEQLRRGRLPTLQKEYDDLMNMKGPDAASDRSVAFDFQTARRKDADGRLIVEMTNISKSNICPYFGREIPRYEELGLDPDRTYKLFRDPVELAKAAPTFNSIQLMATHIATSAEHPNTEYVVGTTGESCVFEFPYLKNSLCVWDKTAIDAIESHTQRELSCSYRYDADMTPGEFEGAPYDGRMVNIIGNHVALVEKGRAGADVFVSDSLPSELLPMSKKSARAVAMRAALSTHLRPLLAVDGAIPQLIPLTRKINTPSQLAKDTAVMFADKLTIDVPALTESLRLAADEAESMPDDPEANDEDETEEERKAREAKDKKAKDKKAKDKKAKDDKADGDEEDDDDDDSNANDEDETEEERKEREAKASDRRASDRKAMDNAIATATRNANAVRQAERDVRDLVGEIDILPSAEAVYRYALDSAGVDNKGVHASALPALVAMAKTAKAAAGKTTNASALAMDTGASASFTERYKVSAIPGKL